MSPLRQSGSSDRVQRIVTAAKREADEIAVMRAALLPPADSFPGYTLIREIGRGGMGIVFEATQEHPPRTVALKAILEGNRPSWRRRRLFDHEIQLVARFNHPAIATFYNDGRTRNGRPFFAMELVEGEPITTYVRDRQLPLRSRLELFCRVCDGIHYAHQKGVIHRDLKPSNIMVDAGGNPKILDFGLARTFEDGSILLSRSSEDGRIIGTIPYMSPEQICGRHDDVDIRSDVYSLGVFLYELMTGESPYTVKAVPPHEISRIICEDEPSRPRTVNSSLRRDHEIIVLKALEKDPRRRYQSALALSDDIQRCLTNQPIVAREPTLGYQLQKLVIRHKIPCTFAAVLFILVSAFGIWINVLYRQAHTNATRAELMNKLLVEAIRSSGDLHFSFESQLATLDDQPGLQADFYGWIGDILRTHGHYPDATEHYQKQLAIRQAFSQDKPDELIAAARSLAASHRDQGAYSAANSLYQESLNLAKAEHGPEHPLVASLLVDLANLRLTQEDYEGAETLYVEALALFRRLPGDQAKPIARCLQDLAELYHAAGHYETAQAYYEEALAIHRESRDDLAIAGVINSQANLLRAVGELQAAEQKHLEALETRRRILGEIHEDVATSYMNLAALLRTRDFARSETYYRKAIETYRKVLGSKHKDVGGPLLSLGWVLVQQGRADEAKPLLVEAVDNWRDSQPIGHWLTRQAESVLGECLTALGDYDEAEILVMNAYAALREKFGAAHPQTREALDRVIMLYEAAGRPDLAEDYRALSVPPHDELLLREPPDPPS